MGLLTKFTSVFAKPDRPATKPAVRQEPQPTPTPPAAEVTPPLTEPKPQPAPVPPAVAVATPPAKSKQQVVEELQRNYREVVGLVRKVDAHLDRDEQRAQELMAIAHRFDEALPMVASLPETMRTELRSLRDEVTQAIRDASSADELRADRLEALLGKIGMDVERTGEEQLQLVETMAGFRESLGDISRSTARSGEVLESIDRRRAEREDELTRMLVASRTWIIVALLSSIGMAVVAVSIAVIALASG
ncbi:MAG: hypothetical protein AAFX05_11865 [Planctomycetota bacterium]